MICNSCGDTLNAANRCPQCDAAPAPKPAADPFPGYQIEHVIGRGGMGVVYLATQTSLGRRVAIKELAPKLAGDSGYVQRFLAEAQSIANLKHDNLVHVIDRGQSGSVYYTVMEYVEGVDLRARPAREKRLDERTVLDIARQAAEGLRYALSRGITHKDVKPSNLLLSREGRVQVCDFGLSQSVALPGSRVLCSPAYASPEALRGGTLDARSDIYALGATMYELLTGTVPFKGTDRESVARKQIAESPAAPRSINASVSDGVQRLVLRMLEKDPSKRPQTYDALPNEIAALSGAKPAASLPGSRGKRAAARARAARQTGVPVVSIAAGLGAIVLVVVIINFLRPGESDPAPKERTPVRDSTSSNADPVPPPPVVDPERRRIDECVARLNLAGLVAACCDAAANSADAKRLREGMFCDEQELKALLRRSGEMEVPAHIEMADEIVMLERTHLERCTPEERVRALSAFVAGIRAGTSARVVVRRGTESKEFGIRFDDAPSDLEAMAKLVSRRDELRDVLSQAPPEPVTEPERPPPPLPSTAASILKSASERAKDSARRHALDEWRQHARASDFAAGVVAFLSFPEADLDAPALGALGRHFEKFDPEKKLTGDDHAAAAKSLWEAAKPLRGKPSARMLEALALGHLGEASRESLVAAKAAGEAMGLQHSEDRAVWGTQEELAIYVLTRLSRDPAKAAAAFSRYDEMSSFSVQYAGCCARVRRAVAAGQGHRAVHAGLVALAKRAPHEVARTHLETLAADLRALARCTGGCKEGRVPCGRCSGKGEITVGPCSECGGEGFVRFTAGNGTPGTKTCPKCHNMKTFAQFGGKIRCGDCPKDSMVKCPACDAGWMTKVAPAPLLHETPCGDCGGRGRRYRAVARACEKCLGLGVRVAPSSRPDLFVTEAP